jgi:hypothetical protein
VAEIAIEGKKVEMGMMKEATKRAMERTFVDNIAWVLKSRPMFAMVAFPIAAGIGLLIGYMFFQLLMTLIASDIGKSLGIDEQSANYIMWIIGVIVFIVVLLIMWNRMGKVATTGGKK